MDRRLIPTNKAALGVENIGAGALTARVTIGGIRRTSDRRGILGAKDQAAGAVMGGDRADWIDVVGAY